MPAYNARQKETQFLGFNIRFWISLSASICSLIMLVIFFIRDNYAALYIFSFSVFIPAVISLVVFFRYNGNLYRLAFFISDRNLKVTRESWFKDNIDDKAL